MVYTDQNVSKIKRESSVPWVGPVGLRFSSPLSTSLPSDTHLLFSRPSSSVMWRVGLQGARIVGTNLFTRCTLHLTHHANAPHLLDEGVMGKSPSPSQTDLAGSNARPAYGFLLYASGNGARTLQIDEGFARICYFSQGCSRCVPKGAVPRVDLGRSGS
jgi:hypothetical protein